nr:MAG: internal scaffolding protein [Microvirus sp.]
MSDLVLPLVRHPNLRVRYEAVITGESQTVQSAVEECDINHIIRRYENTGILPPATEQAVYGDVSLLNDDLTVLVERKNSVFAAAAAAVPPVPPESSSPPDGQSSLTPAPE